MVESLLAYFVVEGPVWGSDIHDNNVWQVRVLVSTDKGKTVKSIVLTFEKEEHAITFKRDINYTMEPTELGEEE